jgi:mannonate dehydratase
MKLHKTINRRKALSSIVKGSIGSTLTIGSVASIITGCQHTEGKVEMMQAKRPVLMNVGCQHGGTGKSNLEFLARHGVFHMDGGSPKMIEGVGWDLEDSLAKKEACEKYGIGLDAYHLPLSSAGIERVDTPNIMLGKSPERDREIEMIQQMISVAGKTGVKTLNYNTTIHKVLRTSRTIDPTRGNASYSTWNYEAALKSKEPKTIAGDVSVDEIFERIIYLLDRLLPVAEEYNVRLANHIPDPPIPVGYRGITRWNSPDVFDGIKRFAQLYESPAHGFNLCLGTVASGLKDPKTEILPIIKWVGDRKQIFNIHLRNIKGGWNNFQEVYPDNGDMDLAQILKELRDVGYDGMVMPDHTPRHDDPASGLQGHAFSFGYLKALIDVIGSEA